MKALRLCNRDAVAFSASAATTGGHHSLGHVPGAALWGVAASAIYAARLEDTFTAAQSGALRISAGFPLTSTGRPAFPMPQSLREPKHARGGLKKIDERESSLTEAVWNLAHADGAAAKEAGEALKGAYLAADGRVVKPPRHERGKTAIEEDKRTAATAQYFQYEHLEAGQNWLAFVDGPDDLAVAAIDALTARVPLRLGRSGLKELAGQFTVEAADVADPRADQLTGSTDKTLVLWCLSDVALIEDWGLPAFAPPPKVLLPGGFAGELDTALSSIATRRYAPYNAWLRAFDREHAVIEAGSVLVYKLTGSLDLSLFAEGIGLWRERGLGLVWPNPPMLMVAKPACAAAPVETAGQGEPPAPPSPQPADWAKDDAAVLSALKGRAGARDRARELDKAFGALLLRFDVQLENAARRGDATPSAAQWSELAAKLAAETTLAALRNDLFAMPPPRTSQKTGMCVGAMNPEWRPLLTLLQEVLQAEDAEANRPALARVARRLRETEKARL